MNRRATSDAGIALITALLAVLLASAMMAGMFAALSADQRSQARDRDQSQAYAAAHAGLEKLTSSLAQLFVTDFSPSAAQVGAIDNVPPTIPGFTYTAPGGVAGSGYAVSFTPDAQGNPAAIPQSDITTGPFSGFKGLMTPYTLTVTARSSGGAEVRLRRDVQTVAVPVFQFGIFGEKSLSFHAGSPFTFGGRVHTNGNLFLAQGSGSTLTFKDKITVVGDVVRSQLANGNPISISGHTGSVSIPLQINGNARPLASTEGSVVGGPGTAGVEGWKKLSEDTYDTNIRNTATGAKRLDLPLVSQGAAPIDLIRRPLLGSNEHVANAPVFLQRYFAQASLRILLSDRAADITGLPTVTATAPVALSGDWIAAPPAGYAVGAGRPPLARAIGGGAVAGAGYTVTLNTPIVSTYLAPFHQIRVTTVPPALRIPLLTVGPTPNVVCTGKTATTFFGCQLPVNVNAGTVITAALPLGGTVTVTTIAPNASAGNGKTLTVAPNGTLPFSQNFAWINDKANDRPTPMTCEGYDTAVGVVPQLLSNCRILGVAVPQNQNNRVVSTHSLGAPGASLLGGFLKIEKQDNAGNWTDVTAELLSLGFAGPNQEGPACGDPNPTAVIRFQRLRDNGGTCNYAASRDSRDYWPNVLFDAREASYRDLATNAQMTMGGVINYVTIDVGNLKRWLSGAIGTTGAAALNNNGYIVYFSDRRGNHNDAVGGSPETAEYGHEDSVNSAAGAASSASNGLLEGGEDRNENATLETYGATPSTVVTNDYGGSFPFSGASNPLTNLPFAAQARVNRQVFFRRALKVRNGGLAAGVNNLPDSGLTVVAENPIYVEGNYNASSGNALSGIVADELHRPAAIIADVITILSNSWSDAQSLNAPNDQSLRPATMTGYRFAMIAGKSIEFTKPGWAALSNWGTDGGVHNFMRMLEDWSGDATNYRGSMVSLYTARQAIGIFKNNDNVYTQGTRNFSFDDDFLTPALLPPGTPMFRDVNTMKFRQILRPNQ